MFNSQVVDADDTVSLAPTANAAPWIAGRLPSFLGAHLSVVTDGTPHQPAASDVTDSAQQQSTPASSPHHEPPRHQREHQRVDELLHRVPPQPPLSRHTPHSDFWADSILVEEGEEGEDEEEREWQLAAQPQRWLPSREGGAVPFTRGPRRRKSHEYAGLAPSSKSSKHVLAAADAQLYRKRRDDPNPSPSGGGSDALQEGQPSSSSVHDTHAPVPLSKPHLSEPYHRSKQAGGGRTALNQHQLQDSALGQNVGAGNGSRAHGGSGHNNHNTTDKEEEDKAQGDVSVVQLRVPDVLPPTTPQKAPRQETPLDLLDDLFLSENEPRLFTAQQQHQQEGSAGASRTSPEVVAAAASTTTGAGSSPAPTTTATRDRAVGRGFVNEKPKAPSFRRVNSRVRLPVEGDTRHSSANPSRNKKNAPTTSADAATDDGMHSMGNSFTSSVFSNAASVVWTTRPEKPRSAAARSADSSHRRRQQQQQLKEEEEAKKRQGQPIQWKKHPSIDQQHQHQQQRGSGAAAAAGHEGSSSRDTDGIPTAAKGDRGGTEGASARGGGKGKRSKWQTPQPQQQQPTCSASRTASPSTAASTAANTPRVPHVQETPKRRLNWKPRPPPAPPLPTRRKQPGAAGGQSSLGAPQGKKKAEKRDMRSAVRVPQDGNVAQLTQLGSSSAVAPSNATAAKSNVESEEGPYSTSHEATENGIGVHDEPLQHSAEGERSATDPLQRTVDAILAQHSLLTRSAEKEPSSGNPDQRNSNTRASSIQRGTGDAYPAHGEAAFCSAIPHPPAKPARSSENTAELNSRNEAEPTRSKSRQSSLERPSYAHPPAPPLRARAAQRSLRATAPSRTAKPATVVQRFAPLVETDATVSTISPATRRTFQTPPSVFGHSSPPLQLTSGATRIDPHEGKMMERSAGEAGDGAAEQASDALPSLYPTVPPPKPQHRPAPPAKVTTVSTLPPLTARPPLPRVNVRKTITKKKQKAAAPGTVHYMFAPYMPGMRAGAGGRMLYTPMAANQRASKRHTTRPLKPKAKKPVTKAAPKAKEVDYVALATQRDPLDYLLGRHGFYGESTTR